MGAVRDDTRRSASSHQTNRFRRVRIEVNSHEGHGTAFNIFLPAIERPAESGEEDTTPSTQVRGGSEPAVGGRHP